MRGIVEELENDVIDKMMVILKDLQKDTTEIFPFYYFLYASGV